MNTQMKHQMQHMRQGRRFFPFRHCNSSYVPPCPAPQANTGFVKEEIVEEMPRAQAPQPQQ